MTVANKTFKFDTDSFPVDAIARMSPESARLMQMCDDVRADARDSSNDDTEDLLTSMDANHDMMITKEEFTSALGQDNSGDAFDFIESIFAQPDILEPSDEDELPPSIPLGQFLHINWGWREYLKTGGGISYPWRVVLENTIGPLGLSTPEERVEAFKQANIILSTLILETKDQEKYPSKSEMEDQLLDCDTSTKSESQRQFVLECVNEVMLAQTSGGDAYIPIGPGDGGQAHAESETILGSPLAYPSVWQPDTDMFESKSMKVAKCLAVQELLAGCKGTTTTMGIQEDLESIDPVNVPKNTASDLAWVSGWTLGVVMILFVSI